MGIGGIKQGQKLELKETRQMEQLVDTHYPVRYFIFPYIPKSVYNYILPV